MVQCKKSNLVNKMHCSVCQQCNTKICHNLYNPAPTKFKYPPRRPAPAPPPNPAHPVLPRCRPLQGGRAGELAGNWTDIINARRPAVAGGRWPRQGWAGRSSSSLSSSSLSSSSLSSSALPPATPSPSKTSPGVVASQCHVNIVFPRFHLSPIKLIKAHTTPEFRSPVSEELTNLIYESLVSIYTNQSGSASKVETEEAENRILDLTSLDLTTTFNTLSGIFNFITANLDVVTAIGLVKHLENRASYDPRWVPSAVPPSAVKIYKYTLQVSREFPRLSEKQPLVSVSLNSYNNYRTLFISTQLLQGFL